MLTRATAKRMREEEPPLVDEGPPPPPPPIVVPMARRPEPGSTSGSTLDVLPVSLLLDKIFCWIAPPPGDLFPRDLDRFIYNWQRFPVQQVCRAWHWHAKALAARHRARAWLLHECGVVYQLKKPVAPRPASGNVVQLQIALSCPTGAPTMGVGRSAFFHSKRLWNDLDKFLPAAYWTNVFRSCPALVRLDLACVPYEEGLLAAILDAASTCCPKLQSLVLPTSTRVLRTRYMEDTNILALLVRVLPAWKTSNGGLLHLSLPWHSFEAHAKRELLELVAKFCPTIQ